MLLTIFFSIEMQPAKEAEEKKPQVPYVRPDWVQEMEDNYKEVKSLMKPKAGFSELKTYYLQQPELTWETIRPGKTFKPHWDWQRPETQHWFNEMIHYEQYKGPVPIKTEHKIEDCWPQCKTSGYYGDSEQNIGEGPQPDFTCRCCRAYQTGFPAFYHYRMPICRKCADFAIFSYMKFMDASK